MGGRKEPIRVAFVLHVMQVAGAEVLVKETICRLGSKIDPVVFCLDSVGELGTRLRSQGVPVVNLGRHPGFDFSIVGKLAREVRAREIDVIHAHQYTPFFYSALSKLRSSRNFALIFTEHGRHYPDIVSAKRKLVNRCLLSHCAEEINAVCRFSADALSKNDGFPRSRIRVIENGIDPARYLQTENRQEMVKRLGLDPSRRYILCVARFHPVKDHQTLITAFARVAVEKGDIDLLLAGDGPLRKAMEQRSFELGLAPRVKFLGIREDVPDLLGAADIFTLTSVSEAASLTLLEAMASALPVVVTDVGGNPEIVRDEMEGLLVPRGDASAIAGAYLRLISDSAFADALGRNGRERVLKHFSLDRTIANYYQGYVAAAGSLHN